ncbi:hypothetical protein SAMN04487991_2216 [Celeribacter neptunius]|uniref:Uncharacterized protein n=1 Tax=Celeribacter neptunius TaxID=588602 RepID=A0A1I3RJ25_9RHOB|nr:hypothetical protein SAMN04487991_2216 [Celeribacter neptunius]
MWQSFRRNDENMPWLRIETPAEKSAGVLFVTEGGILSTLFERILLAWLYD